MELLFVEINARLLRGLGAPRVVLAGGRLRHRKRERTPARHVHHGQRGNFQLPFRAVRAAVEEDPSPNVCFPLWE